MMANKHRNGELPAKGTYTQVGYRTARVAIRDGLTFSQAAGDAHMITDRNRLVVQSRSFYRNNAIYKGMVDRAVSYIVGNGFGLQVTKGNTKTVEKLWKEFYKRPEIRGLLSGSEVSQMVNREVILTGDNANIKTNAGLIQMIESEQIKGKTGKYDDGINKDTSGAPKSYHVCPYNSRGQLSQANATDIKPGDMIFITCPDRPSSTRGVPACQSAFAMLHRINDVCDSEAIAYQMLSRLALSVTRQSGAEHGHAESVEDPAKSSDDSLTSRMTELDYALIYHGEEGEEVKGIERNIPGKDFPASLRMFLRLLGLPLGLPLELVLLDWTESNYSQSRAVMEQAYQTFTLWQDKLDSFFYRPYLEWKLAEWKAAGLIRSTKIEYEWIKPTFPWIDQLKEAKAYGEKVDRGFTSHTTVCKTLGSDRDAVVALITKETIDAINIAKKIEAETGVKVDWRPFAGKLEKPAVPEENTEESDDSEAKPKNKKDSKDD